MSAALFTPDFFIATAASPAAEATLPPISTAVVMHAGHMVFSPFRLVIAMLVVVVAAQPEARLVPPLGGAVEPLVHPPEAVHSARIG
jgi:hypothetical protein